MVAPPSFYKLKTVGDYLKLVGMRVSFGTRREEFFDGVVDDLSDAGTHLILRTPYRGAVCLMTRTEVHEQRSDAPTQARTCQAVRQEEYWLSRNSRG